MKLISKLIYFANKLDEQGNIKLANKLEEIVYQLLPEDKKKPPIHGDSFEEWEVYHEWLKLPENWNDLRLVSYIIRNGEPIIGSVHGVEWRNCNLCNSTLLKKSKHVN